MAVLTHLNSLTSDPRFFSQVTYTRCRGKPKLESSPDDAIAYVIKVASTILGVDLAPVDPTAIPDDAENTGLAVYDILTKVLPFRSAQTTFFWKSFGRNFASMLDTAEFPISSQISFLTFVYARILGMMGPLEPTGPGSFMTYDGSPVELSWVIPSNVSSGEGSACRQLRFAIEPMFAVQPTLGPLIDQYILKRTKHP